MTSFWAYFKKEILESLRQNRYIILAVGFVFWAIFSPFSLKLLPVLLKGQYPAELIEVMTVDRTAAFASYMKDLFSIANLFVVLSLMGILAEEIGSQKLMLPYSKGVNVAGLVLAKTIHYTLTVGIFVVIGFLINFNYITVIFNEGSLPFNTVWQACLLFILYFSFNISLIVMLSSFFRKGLVAGILVLAISFLMPLLGKFPAIEEYTPYYLVQKANQIGNVFDETLIPVTLITLGAIVLFNLITIFRMKNVEVV